MAEVDSASKAVTDAICARRLQQRGGAALWLPMAVFDIGDLINGWFLVDMVHDNGQLMVIYYGPFK